ncbi:phasin family protein [Marinobacterium sp. AK62]|uniref:Phasin family protein n=1 Tax=Marinobacterium alkalitolerans TaxID=1542925 RepID=A0ABS3ZBU2_9GAMM|nr:phasin family protein [Marinobacterium alkalitolerans]MBP0049177.1 phasin family protein [Marinobacterium alkalitolerans]
MKMYDKMKESMQPMVDMAEINKKTTEKLIALQSSYVSDFVNASLTQMKTLSEVREPKAALELQVKYLKEIEAKLTDVAEKEMAALVEAKEQLTGLVEKSVAEMGDMKDLKDMPFMAELEKFMKPMDITAKK